MLTETRPSTISVLTRIVHRTESTAQCHNTHCGAHVARIIIKYYKLL